MVHNTADNHVLEGEQVPV